MYNAVWRRRRVVYEKRPFAFPIRNSSRRVSSRINRALLGEILLGEICVGISLPILCVRRLR